MGSLRSEIDVIRAGRADRQAAASGSVPREDFDAALSRIQALAARITVLEARLDSPAQTLKKPKTKAGRSAKAKSTKKVKLKDTGFPQLASSDIIKHKVLMEYG